MDQLLQLQNSVLSQHPVWLLIPVSRLLNVLAPKCLEMRCLVSYGDVDSWLVPTPNPSQVPTTAPPWNLSNPNRTKQLWQTD